MPTIQGCSTVPWAEVIADVMPRPAPVIYVNVGANKGYNVAEHMGMWSQHGMTNQRWHENILEYARENKRGFLKAYSCGNCGACKAAAPAPHARSGGRVHLLELTASNRALLRNLISRAGLAADVSVHDLAASNASGFITMRRTMAGDERASISHGFRSRSKADQAKGKGKGKGKGKDAAAAAACASGGSECEERIEVVRLDDFAAREGLGPIYAVSIDTEGGPWLGFGLDSP
jgi:FkbM family methyltransferase